MTLLQSEYSADDHENILLVSNSAHTSFCARKVKHPTVGTRRKTFLMEGDFNVTENYSNFETNFSGALTASDSACMSSMKK